MTVTSADAVLEQAPRTRRCRRCDVEINAASRRCPYCGARQFRRRPILGVWGSLVCVILVAVAIFATRALVLAGRPVSFVAYRSSDLVALVPSSYHDLFPTAPHGSAEGSWADASQPKDTETVLATIDPAGSPQARMAALAAKLARQPGVALGYHGPVRLAGGLVVSTVDYTLQRTDYAVFDYDACSGSIAMTVTLSANAAGLLDSLEQVLPQSDNAICDGPDFSDEDRADPAIPLAPR